MGLSELDRYRFDVSGFVLFHDVLDPSKVRALRLAIDDRGIDPPGTEIMEQRFGYDSDLLAWHKVFRDLIDHPLVLEVLAELVGPYARLDHVYGIAMRPGTSGLGLHGPAAPFDASQFYAHRGGRMWSGLLSFAWALSDGGPGDGGFGCIPGSHRAEEPVPAGAEALVVEVPQAAGSLLVFTEALVHCTVPWNGAGNRLSLLYKYSPGNSTWARHPPAPPEVLELLTLRQRRLVEPPYVG
ncbi:MAG: phytanoyl-CoA dioxygenase family protein, partial [Nocardioidaceae bacterium]